MGSTAGRIGKQSKLTTPFTPQETQALSELYDQVGTLEAYLELVETESHPPASFLFEKFIERLPLPLALPALKQLSSNPRSLQHYYGNEVWQISKCFEALDTDVSYSTMLNKSMLYNSLIRFGFDLRRAEGAAPGTSSLGGIEHLEEARKQGKGAILAFHHTLAQNGELKRLLESGTAKMVIHNIEGHVLRRNLPPEKCLPILLARFFERAREALQQGEVVLIAPDALNSSSSACAVPFHGRVFRVFTGFAELSLLTGAPVLPLIGEIGPGVPAAMNILPPIDAGDASMSRSSRIDMMCSQYAAIVEDNWRRMPWAIPLYLMWRHIHRPEVQKPVSRTSLNEQIGSKYVAPASPAHRQMVDLWQELLGVSPIGTEDDFFELGGDILLAMRLMSLVEFRFKRRFRMADFVCAPTVANLAKCIANTDNATVSGPNAVVVDTTSEGKASRVADTTPGSNPTALSGRAGMVPVVSEASKDLSQSGLRETLTSLTEEDIQTLSKFCDDFGRDETLRELEYYYAPHPLKTVLEHVRARLPEGLAAPLLNRLVASSRFREKFYRHENWLVSKFLAELDTSVSGETALRTSLFNNLLVRHGFDLRGVQRTDLASSGSSSVSFSISGKEHLEQARNLGYGVILVGHDSLAMGYQIKRLTQSGLFQVAFASMEGIARRIALPVEKSMPVLRARCVDLAKRALWQNRVVLMLPDADMGIGAPYVRPFHGHMLSVFTGFAELSLLTGAPVLPVLGESGPGVPATLRILPPIDSGDASQSDARRLEIMCARYVALLEDNWRRMPCDVPLRQMWWHTKRPEIPK